MPRSRWYRNRAIAMNRYVAGGNPGVVSQPPEGAAEEVRAGDAAAPSLNPSRIPVNSNSFDDVQEPVKRETAAQAAAETAAETAAATASRDANAAAG